MDTFQGKINGKCDICKDIGSVIPFRYFDRTINICDKHLGKEEERPCCCDIVDAIKKNFNY